MEAEAEKDVADKGIMASESTARSPRDGYTIMMGSVATHAINAALYSKLPFDTVRDFAPIAQTSSTPILIAVTEMNRADEFSPLAAAIAEVD